MKLIQQPADYPGAIPFPPPFPLDKLIDSVVSETKLTASEKKQLDAAINDLAECHREVANTSPEAAAKRLEKAIANAHAGKAGAVAEAKRAAVEHSEAEAIAKAIRAAVAPRIEGGHDVANKIALKVWDGVERKFDAWVSDCEAFFKKANELFFDDELQEFIDGRIKNTREWLLPNERMAIDRHRTRGGGEHLGDGLNRLIGWGVCPDPSKLAEEP